jgi:CheY-like chemotaxis protein
VRHGSPKASIAPARGRTTGRFSFPWHILSPVGTAGINGIARLQVSDTGQGLTPEECARLFTPYYTTKQHGTGLGLAIVQSVVSDHTGRISVASTPGRGTDLYHRDACSERRMSRLLIIDDDVSTLASLARAFQLAGQQADTAESAARALELLRVYSYDVIFYDVVMPGTDGIALLEQIRALGLNTPVVMISGQATVDMAVRATKLGALDFSRSRYPRRNSCSRWRMHSG